MKNSKSFEIPRYFDFYPVTVDGKRGTLYKLCAKSWDRLDQTNLKHAEEAGCVRMRTACQYAPEVQHIALFVPRGTRHGFAA